MRNDTRRMFGGFGLAVALGGGVLYAGQAAAKQRRANAPDTACISNLKQVALATLMYSQDYDQHLPVMTSMAGTQKALMPYAKNMRLFTCPVTKKTYKPNAALSRQAFASIKAPAMTTLFSDAVPHPSGMKVTAFADGHVKGVKGGKASKR